MSDKNVRKMSAILRVGCGKDVSDMVNDRRNLCSDASLYVLK